MKRILTTTGLFLGACFLLSAQETGNNRLVIERKMVERADSWLVVDMTVDLSSLKVASDRSIQYLPTVRRGDSLAVLPPLIVNGRARHILYERMDRDRMENNEFEVYRKNGTEQRMAAAAKVLFQHPNTVRYRLSKIQRIMGMEDDPLFAPMLSLTVSLSRILTEEQA